MNKSISLPAARGQLFGTTLLITGCSVGAGMLGSPAISAEAGFLPSFVAMLLCMVFSIGSGFLILEATLWFKERVNLLTLAGHFLGKSGKIITSLLFISLFYCLFVAYFDGAAALIGPILFLSRGEAIALTVLVVGVIITLGTQFLVSINRFFMLGLAFSYAALVTFGLPDVDPEKLKVFNISNAIKTIPILLVCFGYQNLVPTLTHFLARDIKKIRLAIILGNLLSLSIYTLWNFVILGLLKEGMGHEIVLQMLQNTSPFVLLFIQTFTFFALFTSFLPNVLTFVDFLQDGLKKWTKGLVLALVLIPPALFTLFNPDLFLKALNLAGGFADVLLFGLIPLLIIFVGRYKRQQKGPYTVAGGFPFLLFMLFLTLSFFIIGRI